MTPILPHISWEDEPHGNRRDGFVQVASNTHTHTGINTRSIVIDSSVILSASLFIKFIEVTLVNNII